MGGSWKTSNAVRCVVILMAITLNNFSKKVGNKTLRTKSYDWFKWRVFIDEPKSVLQKIQSVDYVLHPTFPNPNRTITDKESGFALESSGWGSFRIYGTIHYIDGTDEDFEYYLNLNKGWPDNKE